VGGVTRPPRGAKRRGARGAALSEAKSDGAAERSEQRTSGARGGPRDPEGERRRSAIRAAGALPRASAAGCAVAGD
jgi:hypothetical protein